jgi:hypothetical protein
MIYARNINRWRASGSSAQGDFTAPAPIELHKLGCSLGLQDGLGGSGLIPMDEVVKASGATTAQP